MYRRSRAKGHEDDMGAFMRGHQREAPELRYTSSPIFCASKPDIALCSGLTDNEVVLGTTPVPFLQHSFLILLVLRQRLNLLSSPLLRTRKGFERKFLFLNPAGAGALIPQWTSVGPRKQAFRRVWLQLSSVPERLQRSPQLKYLDGQMVWSW